MLISIGLIIGVHKVGIRLTSYYSIKAWLHYETQLNSTVVADKQLGPNTISLRF